VHPPAGGGEGKAARQASDWLIPVDPATIAHARGR